MLYDGLHQRMKMPAMERQVVRKELDGKRQGQELMTDLRPAIRLDVGLSAKRKPDLFRVKLGSVSSTGQGSLSLQIEANFQPMREVGGVFVYPAALKINPFQSKAGSGQVAKKKSPIRHGRARPFPTAGLCQQSFCRGGKRRPTDRIHLSLFEKRRHKHSLRYS